MSRFIEEIPTDYLEGLEEIQSEKEENTYKNPYAWEYGKSQVTSYKMNSQKAGEVTSKINQTKTNTYNFRTAESFLNTIKSKPKQSVDLSAYSAGKRVYHKKFGEGTINYVEEEGDDLKVDITFDKVGHKRLMAQFAGLEII
jgi:hypothetical protein